MGLATMVVVLTSVGCRFTWQFMIHNHNFSLSKIFLQLQRVAMEVISSNLNPEAPIFVPSAYRAVEDFSDEWWFLVHSSPWFRDYWLRERFHDPQIDPSFTENYDPVLPDLDFIFDSKIINNKEEEEERDYVKDLVSVGALKWRNNGRVLAETPRYAQKAPKIVNVKVSPRTIQQPR